MPTTKQKVSRNKTIACIVPGCTRKQRVRGICNSCFQMYLAAVKTGDITEGDAIAAGLILPKYEGRKKSPMTVAIKALRDS